MDERDGLRIEGVVVRYPAGRGGRSLTAVDDVRLHVRPGEVLALLGPSGCGKSSLLRAVAGLEPAAAGRVLWDGRDLTGTPTHRRGTGLLFQDGQLFPHRDVAGNVAFGLEGRVRGSGLGRGRGRGRGGGRGSRREIRARVAELLTLVGLTGFERRSVSTLSGGERQRVALARALAPRPGVLLLDEPLSALDRGLRERLAEDVRRILVDTATTAVFVTHDHDEAFAVADRVAVMDVGRVVQTGTPAELWTAPASRRVAEFLSYEAFVPHPAGPEAGWLATRPGGFAVVGSGAGHAGPEAMSRGLADGAGRSLLAGSALDGRLRGEVLRVGVRAARREVVAEVPGVGRVTAVAPLDLVLGPGDEVELECLPDAIAVVPGCGGF